MDMRSCYLPALNDHGFHQLHYTEWGDRENPRVLVCVHGLTRNARDFDFLARRLADHYRVVCLDVAGRGGSDRLPDPLAYGYPQYLRDTACLLAHLNAPQVDWVGTSMGGILGMLVASLRGNPIRRMVINDVGPFIPRAALLRIRDSLERPTHYPDLAAVEALLRRVHATFGPLEDHHWAHMAATSARPAADGSYRLHHDPRIVEPFREAAEGDVDLWPVWEAIDCPVLAIRGTESDILPAAVAREMTERGPGCELVEWAGIGHAPSLYPDWQVATVADWLLAGGD